MQGSFHCLVLGKTEWPLLLPRHTPFACGPTAELLGGFRQCRVFLQCKEEESKPLTKAPFTCSLAQVFF